MSAKGGGLVRLGSLVVKDDQYGGQDSYMHPLFSDAQVAQDLGSR